MNLHEAAEQALEAMENNLWAVMDQAPAIDVNAYHAAIVALRAALAEPETTHSEDCYQWHHACAIAEVKRLRARLDWRRWTDGLSPRTANTVRRLGFADRESLRAVIGNENVLKMRECGPKTLAEIRRWLEEEPVLAEPVRKSTCVFPQCVSTTRTTCDAWAAGACEERV